MILLCQLIALAMSAFALGLSIGLELERLRFGRITTKAGTSVYRRF